MKNKINKLRKLLNRTIVAGLLVTSLNAQPPSGSIEGMSTDKALTTDTKLSADITPSVNLFGRNRTTLDYSNGSKTPFTLLDLSYNWKNGFGVLLETQFPDGQNPDPRPAIQYFRSRGKFSLYAELSAGFTPQFNGEALIKLRYVKPITQKFSGIAQIETITDFNRTRLTFATQRTKAGLGIDKNLEIGLEVDSTQIPPCNASKINATLGGYLTYKF